MLQQFGLAMCRGIATAWSPQSRAASPTISYGGGGSYVYFRATSSLEAMRWKRT